MQETNRKKKKISPENKKTLEMLIKWIQKEKEVERYQLIHNIDKKKKN